MKRFWLIIAACCIVLSVSVPAKATNGDNLIAIGPIARSMGGVGIAAPQDAISAVFANPAAMCFGPYCPTGEFDFAGTAFIPSVNASIEAGGQEFSADSDEKVYPIPAIGLSVPITNTMPLWRFGLSAYGVSGLGVDYRDTELDQGSFANFGGFPLAAGTQTQLTIMKFAPAVAFQPTNEFSVGAAVHLDYATLDLGDGQSPGYGFGVQLGALYKITDTISLGATFITEQEVTHDNVTDFDGDGEDDDLDLAIPMQIGAGIAWEPIPGKLLFEVDGKWINWSDASGYDDFDWQDQFAIGVGVQYKPVPKLALRAGYNWARNPVDEHDDFDGTTVTEVQGKSIPTWYYETFRVVGFPAVVEHHVTAGIGYEFTDSFALHLAYLHAFSETISQEGTDLTGQPATIESELSEDSVELGLTWRF